MGDIDGALALALIGVAADLQLDILEAGNPVKVYEADLRRAVRRHLNRQLPAGSTSQAEAAIGKEHIRSAGTTDVAVAREHGFSAAIELKWWSDPSNQTDDALWDAVKVATFVREGVADAGYLIAAGSESTWTGSSRLLEFWKGVEWTLAAIRQRRRYFQDMFSDSRGPVILPYGLRTEPVGRFVPIQTVGESWSIRCCRVWPVSAP